MKRAWTLIGAAALCASFGCADSSGSRAVPPLPKAAFGGGSANPVGSDGGKLSRLLFACVGDTRPATENDTAGYPTDVIARIYAGISRRLSPRPPLVVSTGDYSFAASERAGRHRRGPARHLHAGTGALLGDVLSWHGQP